MAIVDFRELMEHAEQRRYAVGYFESWNLESLLAVADAAEATRSPVILGFSGVYLPNPRAIVRDSLSDYAALGLAVAERLSVPCCLLFNESPFMSAVEEAIRLGFGLVMYSDERLDPSAMQGQVRRVVEFAKATNCRVEGEPAPLAGVAGEMQDLPRDRKLTDVEVASDFANATGIDAVAVNVGQAHLHGRQWAPLDFDRLSALREAIRLPLVLHGASSVEPGEIRRAIELGIRKINVGSTLKQAFLGGLKKAIENVGPAPNPYEVLGSATAADVLVAGRMAMNARVIELMKLFGSADQS